tara:strand:+ start:208 stop:471 length:264 start_codon:yes stop_codon:yes gene_type:complete
MTKLSNEHSQKLTELATAVNLKRKHSRLASNLEKECKVLIAELEAIAKDGKNTLQNGDFVVTFKTHTGGGYEVKKWKRFGVDKITSI